MKFSYKFSNLLGSVYRKGNVTFTPDGNSVISPVGNRVTVFDLKNNKSETLPVESRLNIACMALSPDGYTLILVNEEGEAMLCSLISKTVISLYHFHRPVHTIKFSPDGTKFAVTKENKVLVFHAPGKTREFNPFVLYKTFFGALDDTVCIDWTSDSRAFCVGSKDMNTRVYGAQRFTNLIVYSVGGQTHCVVGAFFEKDSLNMYSIGENGHVSVWECDTSLDGLIPHKEKVLTDPDEMEESGGTEEPSQKKKKTHDVKEEKTENKILYNRKILNKQSFRGDSGTHALVSSTAYHKNTHILVTGFEDGAFFLHEMPEFNLIHSLSISDQCIATIDINDTGDWIALACSGLGQLLVWEWQSETYVLKQQGHFNNMSSLAYSPDGHNIATGGDDGKVKVWNMSSGFCFVTFNEHQGGITGVTFNQNGQVVLSSSLDGTVRAFDLNRYRNFRTFTSPRPAQFSCLASDNSGEIVCAGGLDTFEIFVWSMKTGRLLEVLTGHEGPISSLCFSPVSAILASGSWDKTVKLWDVFEAKGAKESLSLITDVLAVTFRPDGQELAVATLDSTISFWNPHTAVQMGSVEGRHDLGLSRKETDKITAKKSSFGKAFSTICYSADGKCILAAGRSKNVCIYSVADQILMKKFEISCNLSFDGMLELLDKRKMTEWGNLSLVDQGEGDDGKTISLPGVRKGDMSSRHWKPEVRITTVQFSPTGRSWAATTTEGLLIYSLDQSLVFDPFELDTEITPASVRKTLNKGEYPKALLMSFRLNEEHVIQEIIESIPVSDLDVICRNLPENYVDKLLSFVANQIESSAHIEFYLMWIKTLLTAHGPKLKQRSQLVMATIRNLQKNITRKYEDIGKLCDHNKYAMEFIMALSTLKKQKSEGRDEKMDTNDEQLKEVYSDSDDESIQKLLSNFSDSDT
ncbi:periodic tryptophan protein 2 homolog [Gigantopelta aegis]|uniref:periodic tryptophan protein 2 homolog n=1 Tax=Gigantopelta aegis TaxID=1735272 RepID=UPI001B88C732|nr:periodic tryptophan protein 2 homolog [Gigantopelta aegis]